MKIVAAVAAALLLGLAGALPTAPALAQNQRMIDIFGNDPCPTAQGGEIVVCNRKPERDRYRIPESLRRSEPDAASNNRGAALAESTDAASRASSGMDNCSPVGAAGHTGCFRQRAAAARADRKQATSTNPTSQAEAAPIGGE